LHDALFKGAASLIERELNVAYAYKPLRHPGLAQVFMNSMILR
jgi:hypothetical protein